jgi:hypothetical protein
MNRIAIAAILVAFLGPAARAAEPEPGADAYTVDASAPAAPLRVGEKGKLSFAITARAPWHVDPRAPLSIKVEAPAGLSFARAQLARKDALDPKAEVPRFEMPFTAAAPGRQEAKAQVRFFLCKDTICAQQTRSVALAVTVK